MRVSWHQGMPLSGLLCRWKSLRMQQTVASRGVTELAECVRGISNRCTARLYSSCIGIRIAQLSRNQCVYNNNAQQKYKTKQPAFVVDCTPLSGTANSTDSMDVYNCTKLHFAWALARSLTLRSIRLFTVVPEPEACTIHRHCQCLSSQSNLTTTEQLVLEPECVLTEQDDGD